MRLDHRPWLIISAREARALVQGAAGQTPDPGDLQRARNVVDRQLGWIAGHYDIDDPPLSTDELKARADMLG